MSPELLPPGVPERPMPMAAGDGPRILTVHLVSSAKVADELSVRLASNDRYLYRRQSRHAVAVCVPRGQFAGGGVELPFGGFKKSGHGREKGFEALYEFSALKTVVVNHG